MTDRLLTTREVAEFLGIDADVRNVRSIGQLGRPTSVFAIDREFTRGVENSQGCRNGVRVSHPWGQSAPSCIRPRVGVPCAA